MTLVPLCLVHLPLACSIRTVELAFAFLMPLFAWLSLLFFSYFSGKSVATRLRCHSRIFSVVLAFIKSLPVLPCLSLVPYRWIFESRVFFNIYFILERDVYSCSIEESRL